MTCAQREGYLLKNLEKKAELSTSETQWEFYNLSFADFALVPNDTLPFDHTLVAVGTNLS